jgi:hypothetical protein
MVVEVTRCLRTARAKTTPRAKAKITAPIPAPILNRSGRLYQGVATTGAGEEVAGAGTTTGGGVTGGVTVTIGVTVTGFLAAINSSLIRTLVPTGKRRICRSVFR